MNILEQKKVKTRKPHKCWGCGKELPKGTLLEHTKSVDEEGFNSCYWCSTCSELWNYSDILDINTYEGIGFGELNEIADYFDTNNVEELLEYCKRKEEGNIKK